MTRKMFLAIPAAALVLIGGCIVSDQLTTITIRPDGSADWLKYQSNIRSTETGAKGAQELKQFIEEFDARKDSDSQRILKAGGEVLESRWLRGEEPYANVAVARFPTPSAFQEFFTIRGEKGEAIVEPLFTQCGNLRRFSLVIAVPRNGVPDAVAIPTFQQARQAQADGISETRIVVAFGRIVDSQGFTVAADKRSALIDPGAIQPLFRSGKEKVELFLEWELDSKEAVRP